MNGGLIEVLGIDRSRLPANTFAAVRYLDGRWREKGEPLEPGALAEFLDGGIRFCADNGLRYPKIVLLRLKQLQRGEWQPAAMVVQ